MRSKKPVHANSHQYIDRRMNTNMIFMHIHNSVLLLHNQTAFTVETPYTIRSLHSEFGINRTQHELSFFFSSTNKKLIVIKFPINTLPNYLEIRYREGDV